MGQLLDQLIGYFRDVMAVAVGCPPQQMLYALPSQAEQVAAIGRELGLATILAMVQILDQTAARLRMSLHGRTLVGAGDRANLCARRIWMTWLGSWLSCADKAAARHRSPLRQKKTLSRGLG